VLWTGALPLHIAPVALALLWAPATLLMVLAGSALCRGQQGNGETTHYELCTAEIFIRALRCIAKPGRANFRVTPKEGVDHGGWEAVRQFRVLLVCATLLAAGLILRVCADAGLGVLPRMTGFAAWFVPLLGIFELRRVLRTLTLVGRHRQLRGEYRTPLAASVAIRSHPDPSEAAQDLLGRTCDITPSGIAVELSRPLPVGQSTSLTVQIPGVQASSTPVRLDVAVQTCRPHGQSWRIGASIASCSEQDRQRIIEYCHVVWPYQRLRGFRPEPLLEVGLDVGLELVEPTGEAGTLQSTG
jgi:PilZ domain